MNQKQILISALQHYKWMQIRHHEGTEESVKIQITNIVKEFMERELNSG